MSLRRLDADLPDPEDVVPLDVAKGHVDVDHSDDDDRISRNIRTAFEALDGAEGILQRALTVQRWALDLDAFPDPGECIVLTLAPVISVDAVKYVAPDGVTLELDEDTYTAHAGEPGLVELAPSGSWPTTRQQRRAVTVEFTAGYEVTPERLVNAMLIMIGDLEAFRESGVVGTVAAEVKSSATYDRLFRNLIFKPA